jgi:hypothetical protein
MLLQKKIDFMNDQELKDFFWTPLLIVTGVSFLVFSEIINFIGGPHEALFCKLGLMVTGVGVLGSLTGISIKKRRKVEADN